MRVARTRQGVTVSEWSPPEEFDGYRIVRELGRGGMGRVFLGHDTLLDRAVAIKFIAAAEPSPEWRQRFLTEGRAVARLSHPNVVAVYRVGEVSGRPYLITEYVDGETLAAITRPVPADQLLRMAIGLARGLAAAHEQGVLHRDLKPSNAIVSASGEAKLLDFGVAKLFAGEGGTAAGVVDAVEEPRVAELSWTVSFNSPASRGLGTPLYMAPEVRAGAPASRRSDVFSLGAVMYELGTGSRYLREDGTLAPWARNRMRPSGEREAKLAGVIDRCLETDPLARFASGRELLDALESIDSATKTPFRPTGNPYRGLNPFEAEHRSLFFGRESDIESMVGRVRQESVLVVVGDSGVGKSSLCRAGLIPAIEEGQLDDGRSWIAARLVPGRQPLTALAESLAPILGQDAANLETWFREEALALERALKPWLRSRPRAGLVVFVDQAEELFTQTELAEAERFSELLLSLVQTLKATRLVVCVRSDFVSRLTTLRGLAGVVSHALYLVGPLSRERLRSTILSPARQAGVSFESDAIVDALVGEAEKSAGGLPLLQFALTELWEARDREHGVITAQAVESIGGVGGALARHADRVLRQLLPEERAEARRLLMSLVTAEGTRSTRTMDELMATTGPARSALEAMIRGRLLVVREVHGLTQYELAHDSLVTQWPALADWLESDAEVERARLRLRSAAQEWLRQGRSKEALLRGRALKETLARELDGRDKLSTEYVAYSRRQHVRELAKTALFAVAVLALAVGATAVGSLRSRRELRRQAEDRLNEAEAGITRAREALRTAIAMRSQALNLFDDGRSREWERAEEIWSDLEVKEATAASALVRSTAQLEATVAADPGWQRARSTLVEALLARLSLETNRGNEGAAGELRARLTALDEAGAFLASEVAPVALAVSTDPVDATVTVERFEEKGGLLHPVRIVGPARLTDLALPPGSYRLSFAHRTALPVQYPIVLRAGEPEPISVRLPREGEVPKGHVYVPPGEFLFGSRDEDSQRRAQGAPPLHPVKTAAFTIGIYEVTFLDWTEFLDEVHLHPGRGGAIAQSTKGNVRLSKAPTSGWTLFFAPTSVSYRFAWNQRFLYADRSTNAEQDWRHFPVSGISPDDAVEFTKWLASSGRVPGARLCTAKEWEHAARGADGRIFTTGSRLPESAANIDATYGRVPGGFGPDEVGLHPESDSPFGIHDMQGNALEIVRWDLGRTFQFRGKGGCWYYDGPYSGRLSSTEPLASDTRAAYLGMRVCSSVKGEQ